MPNFVRVASTADLKPGNAMTVDANGILIALYNVEGKYYATHNTCVHQGGPLGEGILAGDVISCPWHMWEYNVCSGELLGNKAIKVPTYPVEVDGTDIKVGI